MSPPSWWLMLALAFGPGALILAVDAGAQVWCSRWRRPVLVYLAALGAVLLVSWP